MFPKLFYPFDKVPASITVELDKPHSIVEEVFSWQPKELTREQIMDKSSMKEHISTPKGSSNAYNQFSPMTLSKNAAKDGF